MKTEFYNIVCVLAVAVTSISVQAYTQAPVSLKTPWGEKVTPENAWRDYPRPQMERAQWTCLNGLWDYAIQPANGAGRPEKWDGEILVPFPIESSLSGVGRRLEPDQLLWYRRTFSADVKDGERLILNFEQSDFRTQVFVNGVELGVPHEGGQVPFSFDITDRVKGGENELVVVVWDATERFMGARGKQVVHPFAIWYTRTSGLTGTVWLEKVPKSHLASYKVTTDFDAGTVSVTLDCAGDARNSGATVEVLRGGKALCSGEVDSWCDPVVMKLPKPLAPWSPETPDLYDLRIVLTDAKAGTKDVVKGYFGLRKIEIRKDPKGVLRICFNNKFRFLVGTLDQGWWPDGLLTPPSEEAMAFDILALKKMGFDMMRKHIKVEPRRYYHLCDKLGMIVLQDMPSGGLDEGRDAVPRYGLYRHELRDVVDHLVNVPSIVCWIPYNEGWGEPGEFLVHSTLMWVKRYDPTRLVDGPSGAHDYEGGEIWGKNFRLTPHKPAGVEEAADMVDKHDYSFRPVPFALNDRRASFLGEYGAGDVFVKGHIWSRSFDEKSERANIPLMEQRILDLWEHVATLARRGIVGSVYTQTTDVEDEVNGLLTYDRKVWKYDVGKLAAANDRIRAAAEEGMIPTDTKTVFARLAEEPTTWAYSFDKPADGWEQASFDDSAWKRSAGGFGNDTKAKVSTKWTTSDLWLRRRFTLDAIPEKLLVAILNTYHDEDAEIYVNGRKIAEPRGFNGDWGPLFVNAKMFSEAARTGENVLAVHVHQTFGGQYFDTELVLETIK